MRKSILFLLPIATLLLGACAAPAVAPAQAPSQEKYAAPGAPAATAARALEAPMADAATSNRAAGGERLVIKNAGLSVVVPDPLAALDRISSMAEGMGGYVVSSNVYQTTYGESAQKVNQASVTVRVPAAQLNSAQEQIKAAAIEVYNQNVSGQDVTQEYTDLQSRLKNLQAAEAQLREIMASATKTEDVLNVFNQLVQVQGEIEVLKGQIQYYEQSAALSSISVELIPDAATRPLQIGGWRPSATVRQAFEVLVRNLQCLADGLVVFIVRVLPFLLMVFAPLYLVWRALRRRRRIPAPDAGTGEDRQAVVAK
ncbi:MAG: DUF4349 domain-containing protein [Chloroflexi bacterium]|nr:DUF4349 domain-containing protein [Chloroflexota bacterium]